MQRFCIFLRIYESSFLNWSPEKKTPNPIFLLGCNTEPDDRSSTGMVTQTWTRCETGARGPLGVRRVTRAGIPAATSTTRRSSVPDQSIERSSNHYKRLSSPLSPNNWPGSTCCVFDAIGSFEHGQRHPGGDQPRAVRSMRPDGVRNVPNISVGPSRTYLSQQPPASAI